MGYLNFSWLIDGEVAGHEAPTSDDDLIFLKNKGVKALVRMVENQKARVTSDQVIKLGLIDYHEPVEDYTPPSEAQLDLIIAFIKQSLADGKPVGVSCRAGIGRTGTVLSCYLVSKGLTAEKAIQEVIKKRGGGPENSSQRDAVRAYAKRSGIC